MNIKLTDAENINPPAMVNTGIICVNVCAHCGECLKQFVSYPDKLNVVVFYRDDSGELVEWKPKE
jgi:hypothetical protein